MKHRESESMNQLAVAEAKEAALKEKFDQYVKASADKLKFFQVRHCFCPVCSTAFVWLGHCLYLVYFHYLRG